MQSLRHFLNWYTKYLTTRPILTKSITAGIIWGISDIICQKITNKNNAIDKLRVLKQSSYGLIVSGAYFHFAFNILYPKLFPQTQSYWLVKTILLNNLLTNPIFQTGFFVYMDCLNGEFKKTNLENLLSKIKVTLLKASIYWPIVNVIMFGVVAPHYRVLSGNFFGMIFGIFLSYVQNKKNIQQDKNIVSNNGTLEIINKEKDKEYVKI